MLPIRVVVCVCVYVYMYIGGTYLAFWVGGWVECTYESIKHTEPQIDGSPYYSEGTKMWVPFVEPPGGC